MAKFNIETWRRQFYTEVRRLMDAAGSRYLFHRDSDYVIQHCDLNSFPRHEAAKLIEAHLVKSETGIDTVPKTTRRRYGVCSVRGLAEEYGCSVTVISYLLRGMTYRNPLERNIRKDSRFTFEEAEAIRARYRAAHPYKPQKGRYKKATKAELKRRDLAAVIAASLPVQPIIKTEKD